MKSRSYLPQASFGKYSILASSQTWLWSRKLTEIGGFALTYQSQPGMPKDSFLLSKIDQLVDATSEHRLLSFIDAFFRVQPDLHGSRG